MKILVTGGCGFIGSNFIKYVLENFSQEKIINVDKQTYAGRGKNIEHAGLHKNKNYSFHLADICDKKKIEEIFSLEKPQIVVNFAAESHVDRSIENPFNFFNTNVLGTCNLLEISKNNNVSLFLQISTDEVYGSLSLESQSSKEDDILHPRSPYSASKAAAEYIAMSYFHTFGLPVIITRSSNNFGPYQFPEKLISLFITNLLDSKKVPLMHSPENPGLNVRDWIYVEDNCRAIWHVINHGKKGEIYNIGGKNEKTNIEITRILLKNFGFDDSMIEHIPHRKGHDFRYSLDDSKIRNLGFEMNANFGDSLKKTIVWYKNNTPWWKSLKSSSAS